MLLLLLLALCYALSTATPAAPVAKRSAPLGAAERSTTPPSSDLTGPSLTAQPVSRAEPLRSSSRGYIAVLYSGTVRTFSVAFQSRLLNLLAPSPYTVHLVAYYGSGRGDWKTPSVEHDRVALYRGFNATLRYHAGYTNLDGLYVSLWHNCLQWQQMDDVVDLDGSGEQRFNYTPPSC